MSVSVYDLHSVELPYLSGRSLRSFVALVESRVGGLLTSSLLKNAGITWFREQHFHEPPTYLPIHYRGAFAREAAQADAAELPDRASISPTGFHFPTVLDYARAYREGATEPVAVAERFLKAIEEADSLDPPLAAFITVRPDDVMRQAEAATERLRRGEPLGLFDGVPVAVKDEVDMMGYPTTVGTAFLGSAPARADAEPVARMRAAGALLIGKTNMHEIGIGVTGLNPHHGTPRNPYNPAHFTGGSSSGSAAAVAAGLCPVAIGADGGGSIRIPSAFCGVFGLKATYGRVSEFGAFPLVWSVAHVGPIAATATDLALAYGVMAGPDPKDPVSLHQPLPTLFGWDQLDLSDLTLGVFWPWFRHANNEVVVACEAMLDHFQDRGARVQEVVIPDLEAGRVAHVVTIVSEMLQGLGRDVQAHEKDFGLDVRLNLAIGKSFTAQDLLKAQRVRTRLMRHFADALADVDAILTPATALPAPAIPPAALPDGESDLTTLTEIMRFAPPANLTGLPAISFPVGYTNAGLPIGMQAMGRAWNEPLLLRLALAAEQHLERRKPRVFFQLL
ncbi:MAG: amidase [Chloroflexi bacterium]|nr:amidase [Chloroflexota bacterium]